LETCANATPQVIRVVHTQRELSIKYFGKLLTSFGVHARHDGRVSEYVQALVDMEWIRMSKQYWAEHRARTYTAGDEFCGKVRSTATQSNHPPVPIISVPFYIDEDDLALAMGRKTPEKPAELASKPPPWAVSAASAC